ncbi:TIGR03943 family protein [Candidatus Saccharibacteria bacterium]|nr:TIGR03943 family protein [Candidatus Saccharibacteria bacterium]
MSSKKLVPFVGLLSAVMCLFHAFSGSLTLYIHPRYVLFTVIMSSVGAISLAIALTMKSLHPTKAVSFPLLILCITYIITIVAIPAKTLSPRTALTRQQTNQLLPTSERSTFDSFSSDYSHFDIKDWYTLLQSNPRPEQIIDKEAKLNGFFYRKDGNPYIARFRLSCCAVDATPLAIPIEVSENLLEGEWYSISGKIVDSANPKVKVAEIHKIEEPDEPYIY